MVSLPVLTLVSQDPQLDNRPMAFAASLQRGSLGAGIVFAPWSRAISPDAAPASGRVGRFNRFHVKMSILCAGQPFAAIYQIDVVRGPPACDFAVKF